MDDPVDDRLLWDDRLLNEATRRVADDIRRATRDMHVWPTFAGDEVQLHEGADGVWRARP